MNAMAMALNLCDATKVSQQIKPNTTKQIESKNEPKINLIFLVSAREKYFSLE